MKKSSAILFLARMSKNPRIKDDLRIDQAERDTILGVPVAYILIGEDAARQTAVTANTSRDSCVVDVQRAQRQTIRRALHRLQQYECNSTNGHRSSSIHIATEDHFQ
jgi:hypothetical protein